MALLFYPRGGSAQVARYLAAALDRKGWPVRLFTGSLGEPGTVANAATFFAGLDVLRQVGSALRACLTGSSPVDPAISFASLTREVQELRAGRRVCTS